MTTLMQWIVIAAFGLAAFTVWWAFYVRDRQRQLGSITYGLTGALFFAACWTSGPAAVLGFMVLWAMLGYVWFEY